MPYTGGHCGCIRRLAVHVLHHSSHLDIKDDRFILMNNLLSKKSSDTSMPVLAHMNLAAMSKISL